jgi:hypothetical protein
MTKRKKEINERLNFQSFNQYNMIIQNNYVLNNILI